jgi:hypothetical protein
VRAFRRSVASHRRSMALHRPLVSTLRRSARSRRPPVWLSGHSVMTLRPFMRPLRPSVRMLRPFVSSLRRRSDVSSQQDLSSIVRITGGTGCSQPASRSDKRPLPARSIPLAASPHWLQATSASVTVSVFGQRGASPLQACVLRPVSEGNCVVARRGGKQPEENDQSVTFVNSIRPVCLASLLA